MGASVDSDILNRPRGLCIDHANCFDMSRSDEVLPTGRVEAYGALLALKTAQKASQQPPSVSNASTFSCVTLSVLKAPGFSRA